MRSNWTDPAWVWAIGMTGLVASSAAGQTKPWLLYADTDSTSLCDVVNASNVELVVLTTGQLAIITGEDVTLQDTFVDADGFVFFEGELAGSIGFAEDGDGFATLWWTALTGRVVEVNAFTGVPSESNKLPSDFQDVPCDACVFWDDQSVCVTDTPPPTTDPPLITVNLCGAAGTASLAMTAIGLTLMGLVRRRRW